MKVIKKRFNQNIQNEFTVLLKINHENILRYFEHFEGEFNDIDATFIITEYCEVSLLYSKFKSKTSSCDHLSFKKGDFRRIISTTLKNKKKFAENQILDWITQAANGLQHLHKLKYVHRDIKPEYFCSLFN